MITYRKIGGLHFLRLGRVGLCWYWARRKATSPARYVRLELSRAKLGEIT